MFIYVYALTFLHLSRFVGLLPVAFRVPLAPDRERFDPILSADLVAGPFFFFFSTNFNRGNHTKLRPVVGVLREQLLRHGDVRLAQGLEVFPPKHFAANLQDHIGLPRGKVILQGVLLQSLALSGDQCQSRVRVAYPAFFENATPVFRLSSNYGCCVIPMAFETHMLDSNNI